MASTETSRTTQPHKGAAAPESTDAALDTDTMREIDDVIGQVERLYRWLTGHDAPVSAEPYAPIPPERGLLRHVEGQLDRLLDLLGPAGVPSAPRMPAVPAISVWEGPRETVVCVDLPGVPLESIEVAMVRNQIVVSGERPRPRNGNGGLHPSLSERAFGSFRRVLALPFEVQPDAVEARLVSGVLELHITHRAAADASRTIVVEHKS
jgi:HSP20 family protein